MANIGITTISSKGQIVIPLDLRAEFNEGDKIIVMENQGRLILKKASEFEKNIEEDLDFARKTEEAWKSYEKGEFISKGKEEFLNELEKW